MSRSIRHTLSTRRLATVALVMTIITVLGTINFDASHAQQISPEQKAQMCNPNNPKLNFVNSTESKICGIPESVKNQTTVTNNSSTAASQSLTPSVSSQSLTPSARPPL